MKNRLLVGSIVVLSAVLGHGQAAGPQRQAPATTPAAPAGAAAQQAVITQYCVTCHSERAKAGGLSLETADVARAAEDPQLWERVVRKMRAGVMPPPGI